MSRSGYVDGICGQEEQWAHIRWRGAVWSATRGRRGQQMLRELRAALDAMPEKRLITDDLISADGELCALGALGAKRGLPLGSFDPEDTAQVADAFGIADALAREIVFMNDECGFYRETPEARWVRMREWVDRQLMTPNREI